MRFVGGKEGCPMEEMLVRSAVADATKRRAGRAALSCIPASMIRYDCCGTILDVVAETSGLQVKVHAAQSSPAPRPYRALACGRYDSSLLPASAGRGSVEPFHERSASLR